MLQFSHGIWESLPLLECFGGVLLAWLPLPTVNNDRLNFHVVQSFTFQNLENQLSEGCYKATEEEKNSLIQSLFHWVLDIRTYFTSSSMTYLWHAILWPFNSEVC